MMVSTRRKSVPRRGFLGLGVRRPAWYISLVAVHVCNLSLSASPTALCGCGGEKNVREDQGTARTTWSMRTRQHTRTHALTEVFIKVDVSYHSDV